MTRLIEELFPEPTSESFEGGKLEDQAPEWLALAHQVSDTTFHLDNSGAGSLDRAPIGKSTRRPPSQSPVAPDRPPRPAISFADLPEPPQPALRWASKPSSEPQDEVQPPAASLPAPTEQAIAQPTLLDSVAQSPPTTSDGIPILNEWDLLDGSEWSETPTMPPPRLPGEEALQGPEDPTATLQPTEATTEGTEESALDESNKPDTAPEESDDDLEWNTSASEHRLLWAAVAILGPIIILVLGQALKG